MDLDPEIDHVIGEFHSDLDPGARLALAELVRAVVERGTVDASVRQALQDYFSAMGAPGLGSEAIISLAMGFLDRPNAIASTEFYANGRSQLDDGEYREFQRCVLDRLFQESWPLRRGQEAVQQGAAPAAAPASRSVAFGDADYHRVLSNHLGRDRNYAIDSETLLTLYRTIQHDLSEAMGAVGLSPQQQVDILGRFEAEAGREIRELLDQVETGSARSGFVHFLV